MKNLTSSAADQFFACSEKVAPLIDKVFFYSSLFYLALVLVGIRIEKVIGAGDFFTYKIWFFKALCVLSWFCLWRYRRGLAVYLLLFVLLALSHAFACIYQPSLRLDIPVLDYMLSPHASANWTFDLAQHYLWHILGNLCLGSAMIFYGGENRPFYERCVYRVLFVGFAVNLLVASVQYFYSFSFMAQGSGSAVSANRFSGLLEDSAAASLFLVFAYSGLLFYRQDKNWGMASVFKWVIVVFLLFLGAFGSGRLFLICAVLTTVSWATLQLFSAMLGREWRKLLLVLLVVSVVLSSFFYMTGEQFQQDKELAFARKFRIVVSETDLSVHGLTRLYRFLIKGRSLHMTVMSEATTHYFPTGSGLGTFVANQDNYKAHNHTVKILSDWPSSFYLLMTSEWGVSGFLLIFLILLLLVGSAVRFVVSRDPASSVSDRLTWLSLGALLSLMFSWAVGIHFVFKSIGLLIALILMSLYFSLSQHRLWARAVHFLAISVLVSFVFSIGLLYYKAPSQVSSFKWIEKKSPQVPHTFRETLGEVDGAWLDPNSEYVAMTGVIDFYVKHPPEYYPVKFRIQLLGVDDQILEEQDIAVDFEGWQSMEFPGFDGHGCRNPVPSMYCVYRVSADKLWQWQDRDMLVFVPMN